MKNNKNTVNLLTAEGKKLSGKPWNTYPRPQLKRDSFLCLNGEWDFSVSKSPECPKAFDSKILVPFPAESLLSGQEAEICDDDYLIYRTSFALPDGFVKDRVLLHFGAVDQLAEVYVNGNKAGRHTGGYDSFCFDITDYISEKNTLTVICRDMLSSHILPYGKQKKKRGGMWYTPVSGIWQTVWLESVPEAYIKSLKIDCRKDGVLIFAEGAEKGEITLCTPQGEKNYFLKNGICDINIERPVYWSPENPYLYKFKIKTENDAVESYFALRTLETKLIDGVMRLCLNGKPYFFHGLLDQGYWSDGIYTPASPECYENDILAMKELGFNTLRKHIKVEPEQFYYDCDRLGMVVFQDMVNNGDYSFLRDTALPTIGLKKLNDKYMHLNKAARQAFLQGMEKTVKQLYNHPCICCWTIFNEGWGQFDSTSAYRRLRELDSSRLIDTASGWFKWGETDIESPHIYFKPVKINKSNKPIVLSEFGGYSYKPPEHCFNPRNTYGYKFFNDKELFCDAVERLYLDEIIPAIKNGLSGAVYTQVSDVEDETNGLLSYDREVLKVRKDGMAGISEKIKEIIGSLPLDKTEV